MPSLAHAIGLVSGEDQEQPLLKSDRGLVSHVELCTSPRFKNFFTISEVKEVQALGNPALPRMVGLIQSAKRLHGMGPQADLDKVEMPLWNKTPVKREETHVYRTIEVGTEDDRKQLGVLLSIPISRSERNSPQVPVRNGVRKRSHSSITPEPEELDLEERSSRSHTSSDSESKEWQRTQFSTGAAERHPKKIRRTERVVGCGQTEKELLRLSLPISNSSTLNSDSSSSSRELRDAKLQTKSTGSFLPSRSSKIYPASRKDAAQSNMRNSAVNSSVPGSEFEDRADSADDADDAGARDTATHSSSEPMISPEMKGANEQDFHLTLQLDSLKPTANSKSLEAKRAKFHPLTCAGLDVEALNQQSLILRDLDTGLEAHGLQLVHLLLKCADGIAQRNGELAARILRELSQGASIYGDSMQRVAAYFAEGLAARIVSKESSIYSDLMVQPSTEEYFSAFTTLYKVAPYFQFAHFTANQAILEAVEGNKVVHVIDLDIMQGFQWPSLIQALASRKGGPPQLRLTGVGSNSTIVRETGRRLTNFAESFGVPFEFHSVIEESLEDLTPEALAPRLGEAIAVNAVQQLHRLLNPTSGEHLHKFMHSLCRKLNPCVVTLVEQEANHNAPSFLGRFMEALHYYAAVFDSLDASLPQQNEERVKVEQLFFGPQIKNIVVSEGNDRIERHETFDLWQQRMKMAGFFQVPLSPHAISQAKLLLQFCPFEGYRLHQRNGSLCLGWQERQLLTASAWSC